MKGARGLQGGIALLETLKKLSQHLLVLCIAQAAVARVRHTQAELYQK